jgi:hypothetical protein
MTTSFTMTFVQIVKKALKRLGVWTDDEVLTAEMFNSAIDDLNLILKGLRRYGKHLWLLNPTSTQISSPDSVMHNGTTYYCLKNHTSEAVNEPGVGNRWKEFWYASTASDTTPSAWALATDYESGGEIELENDVVGIEFAYIREDDYDTELTLMDRFEKDSIVNKWELGKPDALYFDRYGHKIVLRELPDETYQLFYTEVKKPADFNGQGEIPDVPQEWYDFLIYALAAKQAEEYEIDEAKIFRLYRLAEEQLSINLRNQQETSHDNRIEPAYC